jgi:hypothetical protein
MLDGIRKATSIGSGRLIMAVVVLPGHQLRHLGHRRYFRLTGRPVAKVGSQGSA